MSAPMPKSIAADGSGIGLEKPMVKARSLAVVQEHEVPTGIVVRKNARHRARPRNAVEEIRGAEERDVLTTLAKRTGPVVLTPSHSIT